MQARTLSRFVEQLPDEVTEVVGLGKVLTRRLLVEKAFDQLVLGSIGVRFTRSWV